MRDINWTTTTEKRIIHKNVRLASATINIVLSEGEDDVENEKDRNWSVKRKKQSNLKINKRKQHVLEATANIEWNASKVHWDKLPLFFFRHRYIPIRFDPWHDFLLIFYDNLNQIRLFVSLKKTNNKIKSPSNYIYTEIFIYI